MSVVLANNPVDVLYKEFKEKAGALSAEVHRAANVSEARQLISKLIGELEVEKVVFAPSPLVDALDIKEMAKTTGVEVTNNQLREHAADAGLGISELQYGIAEIGTLVGNATSIESRMVSILPPVHLAVVPTKNLLPTLLDAIAVYNEKLGELPRYLTFVSGPSRTADIERVLTIGVHGPERLIILFID